MFASVSVLKNCKDAAHSCVKNRDGGGVDKSTLQPHDFSPTQMFGLMHCVHQYTEGINALSPLTEFSQG